MAFYWSDLNQVTHSVAVEEIEDGDESAFGWHTVQYRKLGFQIPPTMLSHKAVEEEGGRVGFGSPDGDRLFVSRPNPGEAIRARMANLAQAPEGIPRSIAAEEALTFSVSAADFHWGMTRAELDWLQWLLKRKYTDSDDPITRVMLRTADTWEGILMFMPGRAVFQWHTMDGSHAGAMLFLLRGELTQQAIVEICRSFEPVLTKEADEIECLLIDGEHYPFEQVENAQSDRQPM